MSVLKVKDENGNWHDIVAIKGKDGKDYVLTDQDKRDISDLVPAYDDTELKQNLSQKLTEPENMVVGKYLRIAAIDDNGHAVLEVVDAPSGGLDVVPSNWPEWVEEEQAAARQRIGAVGGTFELVATYNNTVSENTTVDIRFPDCSNVLIEVIAAPQTVISNYGLSNLMQDSTNVVRIEFGSLSKNTAIFSSKIESYFDRGIRRTNYSDFISVNDKGRVDAKAASNGKFFSTAEKINRFHGLIFNGTLTVNVYGIKA